MQEDLIIKYLKGLTSPSEENDIEDWISHSEINAGKFNLIKAQYIASTFDETSKMVLVDRGYAEFKKKIRRKGYYKLNHALKYAALILIIFGTGYIFTERIFDNNENTAAPTPNEAITLKLEDGNIQVITKDLAAEVMDSQGNLVGTQNGAQLVYHKNPIVEKLVYNTLTVPYGERFDVVLSDGTKVLLNAGTSIKYPIKFMEGKNREVFLSGEAFFDVAKDLKHPFIVNSGELNVRVLGTQFNITSYPEDEFTNTILVEGSVSIYDQKDTYHSESSFLLIPGRKASWNKVEQNIFVEEVDTSLYTSWINGRITFRHMPFKYITKKLERHYNIVIVNNDKELENKFFTASFDVETIEQVFESFERNHGISYHISDKHVTINP